jgi:transcriptional regulator with XRE-family HTH domain
MEEIAWFGQRLRALREDRRLTQQELGDKAGLSYKYLGSVERGSENPSLRVILKLAEALEVEPRHLFEFHHEATSPTVLRKELNRLLRDADQEKLQQAVKLMRALFV